MSVTPIYLQGTVTSDGTLELDGKVPLPPGKVSVALRRVSDLPDWLERLKMPAGDPFFDMLRDNWLAQARTGEPFRTGEEAQEALRRLREEAAE